MYASAMVRATSFGLVFPPSQLPALLLPVLLLPVLLLLVCSALWGCTPPDPPEDAGPAVNPHREDLDASWEDFAEEMQAIAIASEPGALAGTFARKAISATIVNTVVQGYQTGGGENWLLSVRTWNEDEQLYEQQSELCGGLNFEVAGVLTGARPAAYRRVPKSTVEKVRVDDERGTFLMTDHLQLWALRDLPDPFTTELPADADAAAVAPWPDRIYDIEEDGRVGLTLDVSGLVEGEVYAAQRKKVDLAGVVTADGVAGYTETTWETVILGNNNPLLDAVDQGGAEQHPERDQRWFVEVRVDEGTTCDDVLADKDTLFATAAPWL
jgi:hypothetical protein